MSDVSPPPAEPKVKDWQGDLGDTEAIMERWSEAVGHTITRLVITRLENGKHSVTCEFPTAGWRLPRADEVLLPSWQFVDPPGHEDGA